MNWSMMTETFVTQMLSTIVLIAVVVGLRTFIVRRIKQREDILPAMRRRWIVSARNITVFLIISIVFIIWLEQLRTVAATIVVVAAAIVVATKEFLLNIVGFFYQSTFKFISVGDRIEIEEIRGDVIDHNLMGITLLEIGPSDKTHQHTGLTIFIPNSKLLLTPIKNETQMWGDYVFHLVRIPIKKKDDWQSAEQAFLQAAAEACAPYLEEARHSMMALAAKHSLDVPTADPRVQLQISDPEEIDLVLRLPVPTRKRGRTEQQILRRYLEIMRSSGHLDVKKAGAEAAS